MPANKSKNFPVFAVLLCLGIFLCIISPYIFSHGIFMDGLIYGAVAKNEAAGNGTFWNPHFTKTLHYLFHEHPPLVFGVQSLFFKLFGNGIYTERIYSLLLFLLSGTMLVLIWKQITGAYKMCWLPLLFWVCTPPVSWACQNNVLENTLTFFVLAAVLFYLKYSSSGKIIFLIASALFICLGILTKGPVALFTLALPFCHWLALRNTSFFKMCTQSFLLVFFALLPIFIIYFSSSTAAASMQDYLQVQVLNSLKNVSTVTTRFYIVGATLLDLMPSLAFCLIAVIYFQRKRMPFFPDKEKNKLGRFFIFLGLCGVLPIMISLKQRSFYAVPVFPVFILGFADIIYTSLQKIELSATINKVLKFAAVLILAGGISSSIFFAGKFGRDEEQLTDVFTVIKNVPDTEIISICHETRGDWYLHGYFGRYSNVSLDDDQSNLHSYYLVAPDCESGLPLENYELKEIGLKKYKFYARK